MNQEATDRVEQKPPAFPGWRRPVRAVQDLVALKEIELYVDVIIAARESPGPLTREALDRVLGLDPRGETGPQPHRAPGPFSAGQLYRAAREEAEDHAPDFDVRQGAARFSSWLSRGSEPRAEPADR